MMLAPAGRGLFRLASIALLAASYLAATQPGLAAPKRGRAPAGRGSASQPLTRAFSLSSLMPTASSQGWGSLGIDRSVMGRPLRIAGRTFRRGLGTHATSEIAYDLDRPYRRFEAWVGVDDEMVPYPQGSVAFQVVGDGRTLFASGVMRPGMPARRVSVPLVGVRSLRLVVRDAGDGINADHADWADPVLIGTPEPPLFPPVPRYRVASPALTLRLAGDGRVAGLQVRGQAPRRALGETRVVGCSPVGAPRVRRRGAALEFTRELARFDKARRCTLVERFTPTPTSVRWEVTLRGSGGPWTAPIVTRLVWPRSASTRFWTAWSDPDQRTDRWQDPLETRPFADRQWGYGGNASQDVFIALPLATVLEPARRSALSLVLSPEDTLLDLSLATSRDGALVFSRTNHRLGQGRALHFALDLVPHEADPRAALGWLASRYPALFDPPNPRAWDLAGCGAYSAYEGPLDAAKLRRMAFRVNWKASYDFPYMGMFLPPLPGEEDRWRRFDAVSSGEPGSGRVTTTSRRQLEAYSRAMRAQGFHVLNYFNTTEFGAYLKGPEAVDRSLSPRDRWRDATTFLYSEVADGILYNDQDRTMGTWGGAIAMDPGGPRYRRFLLEQARRHVEALPSSDGICIDRLDWLAYYNRRGDDGVSWRDGRPVRSVLLSWRRLMAEMGPIFHRANKVIFANPLVSRLEVLRQVDGIYDEMASRPARLNASTLLGLRKPVLAWTSDEGVLKPDPDAFFQRHLYLGAFPTAPFPENDHTINPSAWADEQYTRYGPLLDTLRGRTWVLQPHVVSVPGSARANLFRVPGGYVVPVIFGGRSSRAEVTLRGLPGLAGARCEALLPGAAAWVPVRAVHRRSSLSLSTPLARGCAVIRIGPSRPRKWQGSRKL